MPALLVTNLTHVLGLFTYALVLSVVIDDVGSAVGEFKRGNHAVFENGHTVVLNRNRHTAALLRQVRCWALARSAALSHG